jgi:hypothetical protein
MTKIKPFKVKGLKKDVKEMTFDVLIPYGSLPVIHFKYIGDEGEIVLSNNFQLTDQEFDAWDETMESLSNIVISRLELEKKSINK